MKKFMLSVAATIVFGCGCLLAQTSAMKITADTTTTQRQKAPIPLDLPLSGTVNGNQYQKGSKIVSTQSIESGKTTYLAEEEVILNEGFEVKDGAEFEVLFDRDSFHIVTMLTYNVWGTHTKYEKHLEVIQDSKADVVSLQEVKDGSHFSKLTNSSVYKGEMCTTTGNFGIGMLWNPNTVGNPIEKDSQRVPTPHDGSEEQRAYMVAEFRDFCFVATHYSLNQDHRNEMTNTILQHRIVQKCNISGKPVYVAGDMNELPEDPAITIFIKNGYHVLNTIASDHATRPQEHIEKKYIDLILEHNTTSYHKTIDNGIPIPKENRSYWLNTLKVSDHFPYFVKLKVQ